MRTNLKNYVINLSSDVKRKEHIITEFGNKNVEFEFVNAFTPELAFSEANSMGLVIRNNLVTDGEVACFLSHVSIWKRMIDENISHAAIFEDDVILGQDADKFLCHSDWLKDDWNIIKIEKFNNRILLSNIKTICPDPNRELKQLISKHYGCAGYILSLNAAKELLAYLKENPLLIPLDHIVFENFIPISSRKILQLVPALCIQDNILNNSYERFPSDLELARRKRMRQNKKKGIIKILGEFSRIMQQLKLKLFGTEVGFR